MAKSDPVAVAKRIAAERYADADVVLLAGSVVRGTATPSSDLDLDVIFPVIE